ncbi:c-type cytochrome [Galbibacter sp. EGI 63066]|uniref:c-type cytochrome n=1 Tax=Galbibacter sp. EGI 63066 TaxID=2993559 RepID=UPI002248C516|nr:c-type cytochrome [Galbibacter sp. EGI 63066]MCX2679271.1 c-type cytochrome [Galbibacter sp. EGI 63066]
MSNHNQNNFIHGLRQLYKILLVSTSAVVVLSLLVSFYASGMMKEFFSRNGTVDVYEYDYGVSNLKGFEKEEAITYGYELFKSTQKYLGPDSESEQMNFAGNRLSCNNCHLQMGTKPYAAPLIGIVQRFPQFRNRENKLGTLEERINGCMQRSMNGRVLPEDSKEMKAFIAYLEWLSRYAPDDGRIEGQGFVKIQIPNRPVNLKHGKEVFVNRCTECHGNNGQGKMGEDGYLYQYPPLWGEDSYNNGAGMTRVITAANFIKANMPYGTTYEAPVLTDEEAYDVAGFINQQNRPEKKNLDVDFPDLKKKPVSTPYGPYTDNFSEQEHQLGPFQPIMEYYKKEYNLIKNQ